MKRKITTQNFRQIYFQFLWWWAKIRKANAQISAFYFLFPLDNCQCLSLSNCRESEGYATLEHIGKIQFRYLLKQLMEKDIIILQTNKIIKKLDKFILYFSFSMLGPCMSHQRIQLASKMLLVIKKFFIII